MVNGERTQGSLNGQLTMNGGSSKVIATGSLLGEIAAQVGGSLTAVNTNAPVVLPPLCDTPISM